MEGYRAKSKQKLSPFLASGSYTPSPILLLLLPSLLNSGTTSKLCPTQQMLYTSRTTLLSVPAAAIYTWPPGLSKENQERNW